ncbi:MAG: hypothetical protein RBT78_01060 [Kiritimatiellia bacterium]|jgi:type II secretory pathway pseudopilin PulG|nr:hypothetical protein [Kiritimatiellia bacterium]
MDRHSRASGFILPVVVCGMLVIGVIAGGLLQYVLNGIRATGVFTTASVCRLCAQSALDREKTEIYNAFRRYLQTLPTAWNTFAWFDNSSAQSIGTSGYSRTLMRNEPINGCSVTVTLCGVTRSAAGALRPFARITLRATASAETAAGIPVVKAIEEVIDYTLDRSSVFDYAYFVNNFGWFMGGGVTANGDIRANGNLSLDGNSWVNGDGYAAANSELGAIGQVLGTARNAPLTTYRNQNNDRSRPTSPTAPDGVEWPMGYDGTCNLNSFQQTLDMPFLGDLDAYREIANAIGGTVKQQGNTLVDGCYRGPGPSGLTNGADQGCLILDGTAKPILLDGPVVVDSDVIIKGTVKGQGVIYSGRNIYIVGDLTYDNPPEWDKPDTKPEQTAKKNETADMLGLAAKGNIVLGDYTDSSWLSGVDNYITPPFVKPYDCDPTDAAIGYNGTFNGDYTARDGGKKVEYVYDKKLKRYVPSSESNRRYYESAAGNRVIAQEAQSGAITRIDAVLYNNHATMGRVGACSFNGALVCRDEAILYNSSVTFNWDIRLGSASRDGMDFFIYLPMSPASPQVMEWQELTEPEP